MLDSQSKSNFDTKTGYTFNKTVASVQLGTKRNYKAVEEKLLGFVLVYKLACTELHGSDSFVKRCIPFLCQNSTLIVNI